MVSHKNLEGKKFGKLIVVNETPVKLLTKSGNIRNSITYNCKCDCGNYTKATGSDLVNKVKQSCGCIIIGGKNKKHIIKGDRFGKLTVIKELQNKKTTSALQECKCDCGNITNVIGHSLRNGTKSCGCLTKLSTKSDLMGQKFNNLLVIKRSDNTNRGLTSQECKCDCGNYVIVTGYALRNNRKKSCGCITKTRKNVAWRGIGDIPRSYYSKIKRGAVSRNYEFSISFRYMQYIFKKQNNKCAISGINIQFNKYNVTTASLDRIDNNKGYVEGNLHQVHKDINRIKMNLDIDYFIQLCNNIGEYSATK